MATVVVYRALKQSYHNFQCCAWFSIILCGYKWIIPLWFRAFHLWYKGSLYMYWFGIRRFWMARKKSHAVLLVWGNGIVFLL